MLTLFLLASRYDADTGVLKRPLPEEDATDSAPQAKRQKSEEEARPHTVSIEDKVTVDGYDSLESLLVDVTVAANAQLASLQSRGADQEGPAEKGDTQCAKIKELKAQAHELFRRELAYPSTEQLQSVKSEGPDASEASAGRVSLMTYANIGGHKNRPLLTSLPMPVGGAGNGVTPGPGKDITETRLPNGITLAHALKETQPYEKPSRTLTLGELFPSPRNLPPLQPPRPTKSTTKSNVLTFYHPMLSIQSRYRTGTYFSQPLATGQWLDYSNATPAAHAKVKQRERAQSLAGVKPSTTELEMSEMDTLFRRAFSSFAPCKDDTAAVVPTDQLSRMYWQRYGRRNLQRIITSEIQADEAENTSDEVADNSVATNNLPEIDEEAMQEIIDTWDDSVVDPSLSDVMGQKSDEEKEVEDLLQEVTDMIETLASYQRNRNLTLPTSQDRFSADPPNGDMLRNGALSHQPTEEEMLTYQALKAQLSLIIATLPPFAVARINSDKLHELSVSTKIEIRTDDYKGVMEEDEQAARVRQAAVQASTSTQQRSSSSSSHRAPSMSGSVPYSNHQYGGQYAATGRSPMPGTPQHYAPQTPSRAQQPTMYQRPTSAVPIPQPHQAQVRHLPQQQQPQQYRAPNGYGGLAPQLAKAQTPYGHSNMTPSQYNASAGAGQPRMQPHAGYNVPQSASPNPAGRLGYQQSPYGAGYPPQQAPPHAQQPVQPPPQQQQMHPPQHQPPRSYSPYVNGAGQMAPQRTMSPQVGGQSQPHHGYSQTPTPPQPHQQPNRAPQYGTPNPNQVPMPPNGRNYNVTNPGIPPPPSPRGPTIGVTGYHTVMGDAQEKQVLEQARQQVHAQQQVQAQQQAQQQARLDAQSRASTFGHEASQGSKVAGLAGIGLSGSMDIQRMAAVRAANMGHNKGMSQSPMPGLNGDAVLPPPVANNMSPTNHTSPPVGGPGSVL